MPSIDEFLAGRETVIEADLSAIVQRFLVSPAIAAIALCQAGYIDATTKREWKMLTTSQLAIRFDWSDQYRALQIDAERRRAPQRLLARAIRGYAERLDRPMRETKKQRLRSAQNHGQLPDELDLEVAVDLIWSPLLNR